MVMTAERVWIGNGTRPVCGVRLQPEAALGTAVVVHGYGGCKEEQLGLAWRIADAGFAALAIDHRGHGENKGLLDEGVLEDVEAAIALARGGGRVVAIGHSSGGRMALVSSADFAIGISPAPATESGAETRRMLANLRGYRVRETRPEINFENLRSLPAWRPDPERQLVLYGSRDIPEIIAGARLAGENGVRVVELAGALHTDIFLLEETFRIVVAQLRTWLC